MILPVIGWVQREFTISQTPQVWIDNQVMQKGDELIINWDCIDELVQRADH